MSSLSSITPADPSTISREEIPARVHETLCEQFGADQDRRYRGCFISQSLREVMEFLPPEQIIKLKTTRTMTDDSSEMPVPGDFDGFTTVKTSIKTCVGQCFDRKTHGVFPWAEVRDWLDEHPELHDLAITSLVVRLDGTERLHEQLTRLLRTAIGFTDTGELTEPFYAVMSSTDTVNQQSLRRAVTKHHHPRYFSTTAVDGEAGLGWKKRTLDLDAIWSYRAFTNSENTPFYGMTMRDIEDRAINHTGQTDHEYGAINSPLVINKWRQAFSRGTTQTKPFTWTEQGEWVRVGGEDT